MSATLVSIQIAMPKTLGDDDATDPMDRRWTTGYFKRPVYGLTRLCTLGLEGDGQADLVNHGGPDKAVCAYPADHYPFWREQLNQPDLSHGAFGENFTIAGLTEPDVCIGDMFGVGVVELQVSQPRQPCWKMARRWRLKDLPAQLIDSGRTGWYFRVLNPGIVAPETPLELLARPHPDWPVSRANDLMHHDRQNTALAAELARVPALSVSWRRTMEHRVGKA
jgi:MOSC domain-containing protein YiiM